MNEHEDQWSEIVWIVAAAMTAKESASSDGGVTCRWVAVTDSLHSVEGHGADDAEVSP